MHDNKFGSKMAIQVDPIGFQVGARLMRVGPEGGTKEVALVIKESEADLASSWGRGKYQVGQVNLYSPETQRGLFNLGIYSGSDIILELNLAVISKRGEIYELLAELVGQVALHVYVFDQAGRSIELIELKNPYRLEQHKIFDDLPDIELEDMAVIQRMMDEAFDIADQETVASKLQDSAGGS
ncbi:hypothetical protein [Antarcticimicrobium sediminis]|uniref:Uncharacterized protein n=1 Tax=Antarcticimicrobium sediminis TaxID=2546227 RepID=A0A4R5EVH3_9RHOB|nr:hypothetical protein [Antarcticimicrobium sediminis]TDE38935.1 hypothetical protein E1B25_07910 [Antarcticimicrobium sediminis]